MIPFPKKKYQIIYADPPWRYDREYKHKGSRDACMIYNTMTIREVCEMPIQTIAEDDCILFLWVTFPKLQEGLNVIKLWGFEYKTVAFTWVKKNKKADSWFWGMGRWTRSNAEVCLLATKGNPKRISASVHSVLDDRILRHSQKPNSAREKIIELCGDIPRIELFARQRVEGWDCWGNEI